MTTLSTIDESKGAPPDFYTALMHGGLDTPMLETCDAQLRRIATQGIDQPTPGWIDPAVWQKQAPTEWERIQAAIPVLQSLNDVPWDPYHSERTVEDLAVLLAPTLGLNGQESAPLPALWDKCDLVQ